VSLFYEAVLYTYAIDNFGETIKLLDAWVCRCNSPSLFGSGYWWNDIRWFPYCLSIWLATSAGLFYGKWKHRWVLSSH